MVEKLAADQHKDSIQLATELGRLDFASALLACIGLILVAGGIFAFINFRAIAKKQAKTQATEIAEKIAEQTANEYMQKEGARLVKQYVRFYMDNPTDDEADDIANAQDS